MSPVLTQAIIGLFVLAAPLLVAWYFSARDAAEPVHRAELAGRLPARRVGTPDSLV